MRTATIFLSVLPASVMITCDRPFPLLLGDVFKDARQTYSMALVLLDCIDHEEQALLLRYDEG